MGFMLTGLRYRLGLPLAEFVALARETRLTWFLADNYDLLHYYGNEAVVGEMIEHIDLQRAHGAGLA
jgi:hypothetical protein